jgi:hypothetical protein
MPISFPVVLPACFFLIEVPDNMADWIFRKHDLDIAVTVRVPALFRNCESEVNASIAARLPEEAAMAPPGPNRQDAIRTGRVATGCHPCRNLGAGRP